MPRNSYSKFDFKELTDVYTSTIANYGKIEGDLLNEINLRGGEEAFRENIRREELLQKEKQRIIEETVALTSSESDVELVKKLIQSKLLEKSETDKIINAAFLSAQKTIENKKITAATIAGCLLGIFIGVILGNLILFAELYFFNNIFYFSFVIIYGVTYLAIRILTKQNASNILVLLSALIATIVSIVIFLTKNHL